MFEFIVFLVIAIFVIAIITGVVKGIKQNKSLTLKKSELGAIEGIHVKHVEGLGLSVGASCEVFRFDDRLLIDANSHKFEINYSKLRAAVVKSEQELLEKGKSVVGRAVIGTLLVPGLGTIVGGMSGIGSKKKKGKTSHFMIINYIGSNGDMAAVTFQDDFKFVLNKFCSDVNTSLAQTSTGEVIQL